MEFADERGLVAEASAVGPVTAEELSDEDLEDPCLADTQEDLSRTEAEEARIAAESGIDDGTLKFISLMQKSM